MIKIFIGSDLGCSESTDECMFIILKVCDWMMLIAWWKVFSCLYKSGCFYTNWNVLFRWKLALMVFGRTVWENWVGDRDRWLPCLLYLLCCCSNLHQFIFLMKLMLHWTYPIHRTSVTCSRLTSNTRRYSNYQYRAVLQYISLTERTFAVGNNTQ